ncbi:hypothetical protein EB001_04110 [bacterium]|nr:hypothetical protein [bacterium]
MAISLVYDPRYHTFESWASLMVEAYAAQQLQIPTGDTNWQDWAAGMCAIDIFSNQGLPNPYQADTWDNWAAQTVNIVNAPTNEGNNILGQS